MLTILFMPNPLESPFSEFKGLIFNYGNIELQMYSVQKKNISEENKAVTSVKTAFDLDSVEILLPFVAFNSSQWECSITSTIGRHKRSQFV